MSKSVLFKGRVRSNTENANTAISPLNHFHSSRRQRIQRRQPNNERPNIEPLQRWGDHREMKGMKGDGRWVTFIFFSSLMSVVAKSCWDQWFTSELCVHRCEGWSFCRSSDRRSVFVFVLSSNYSHSLQLLSPFVRQTGSFSPAEKQHYTSSKFI